MEELLGIVPHNQLLTKNYELVISTHLNNISQMDHFPK